MNKIKLLFICLLLLGFNYAQNNWDNTLQPDISEMMLDIFMVSETEGWVAGNEGAVYHTTDGFATFTKQTSGTDNNISSIYFIDANTGWMGTKKGEVLRTTDGGATWEKTDLTTLMSSGFKFSVLNSIYFVNKNLGFTIAGKYKNNFIFKTTDGGATWAKSDSLITTSSAYFKDIRFYDENNGVIVGDKAGTHFYTKDGGDTWIKGDENLKSYFSNHSVRYLSKDILVSVAAGSEFASAKMPIYKSADGGVTWTKIETNTYDRAKDLFFKDSENGIAVGNNGFSKFFVYKTSDAGETWTEKNVDFSCGAQAVSGIGNTLYVLGTSSHLFKSTDFGETFEIINLKSPARITDIEFINDKGYAVNVNGDFFEFDNSSQNWNFKTTTGICDAYSIEFTDDNTGYILKTNRRIIKTTNGGATWKDVLTALPYNSKSKVGGITFPTPETGYAWLTIDNYSKTFVFKSSDSGESWNQIAEIAGGTSFGGDIVFFDADKGVLGGPKIKKDGVYHTLIKYTEDGGQNWTDATITAPDGFKFNYLKQFSILKDGEILAAATNAIFKSSDYGKNWEVLSNDLETKLDNFYNIAFNNGNGAVSAYDGTIAYTSDYGVNWKVDSTMTDVNSISQLRITSDNRIFAGHYKGKISANKMLLTSIDDKINNLVTGYSINQNYPNPFNPTTTIEYIIPEESFVTLTVYNVLGKKVAALVNKIQKSGNYKINFDAANLASGVYFYKIKAGSYRDTKRMLLIK